MTTRLRSAPVDGDPRGSNQAGMRQFNDRVVLQAIRRHGPQPQSALALLTQLSVQTVALIIARLESEELLVRLEPVRGKVGQPSVPIALNPDGAFVVGISIGRRRTDAVLMDHVGEVRHRVSLNYEFPDPDVLFDEIDGCLETLRKALKPAQRKRLYGLGVAAPLSLGGWKELLHISPELADRWHQADIAHGVASLPAARGLELHFVKDSAAGGVAELVAGIGRQRSSYLYFFVDTFIGGALVLDGHLHPGQSGNAGAVGSLEVAQDKKAYVGSSQLLGVASLWRLEEAYRAKGLSGEAWQGELAFQPGWKPLTQAWLVSASAAIASAVHSAACLLDVPHVVIDGACGPALLDALIAAVETALGRHDWEGVNRPTIERGKVGADARALGAAMLPLYRNQSLDRRTFMKPVV